MATAVWYHRDISRVQAEELLARAGKDGSYLVRDSESVPGAYALCLLFQRHVHTYRILPDADGLLAVQTTQGVQVNCFRTLEDLVFGYQQPHKGLVSPLLYGVPRDMDIGDESSDDEKPPPVSSFVHTPSVPAAPTKPAPLTLFLDRFQELNTCSSSNEVASHLKDYLSSELPLDIENVHKGAATLRHLRCALGTACQGLHGEIDLTLSSLETLAKVFDHPNCSSTQNKGQGPEMEMDSLLCKISALVSLLSSLEQRVLKALQEAVTNHNLAVQQSPPPPEPTPPNATPVKTPTRALPVNSFQVKMKYGRQTVSVDVDSGVLLFDGKAVSIGVERISHERILQIVKLQSKIRMVIDSHRNTPREMMFESVRKRDAFCHLLQLMKTRHSQQREPDVISVFVGTWNMGGSPPPRALQTWMTCCGLGHTPDEATALLPHDIYAVGTQENPQGEKEWSEHIKATLRSYTHIEFKQVAVQSLWNMRLAVFVKPEHEARISHVNTASVRTGLGNTLGNKGAVGVSFLFNGTPFGFVNCHLTSGSEKILRRNQNFMDILRLLCLGEKHSTFDISLRFTHLFWCGDLNYRLDLEVQDILKHVSRRAFDELMCADQLTRERHKRKAFLNFNEEKITFPPTYRYERGSRDCYLWQKYKTSGVRVNVPSWCDRILWKSYPETHITCTAYGCTDDIFTSDHSPVFATFEVGVVPPLAAKTDVNRSIERAWIELEGIEAIVKTASKAKFFIEFHSCCLEETRRSSENDSQSCDIPRFLKLGWSFKQLPKLLPVMSDLEYLQDQHLLLSVKSCDGFESYGECCVALRSLIGASEQFETFLCHRGEDMGSIRGRVRLHVPKDRRGVREKVYELFCFEKDRGRSQISPISTRISMNRSSPAPAKLPPSNYTNPAYFIVEGVSVGRRSDDAPPAQRKDPQVVWSGKEALQLPKISGHHGRVCRRSDFTEIEIPAVLIQCTPTSDLHSPHTNSSYQLFPTQAPSPTPSQYQEQNSQARDNCKDNKAVQDSVLPEKTLRNLYINHSFIRDESRRGKHDPAERTKAVHAAEAPLPFPYAPTQVAPGQAFVPWVVEQTPPGPTGDNSLTALQIAKSLSEVDFFPAELKGPFTPSRRSGYKNGPSVKGGRGCSWEKEVKSHDQEDVFLEVREADKKAPVGFTEEDRLDHKPPRSGIHRKN